MLSLLLVFTTYIQENVIYMQPVGKYLNNNAVNTLESTSCYTRIKKITTLLNIKLCLYMNIFFVCDGTL